MKPLVSIIIPAYNVEKYINRGINSVLKQTYPNIQLVVIDDGSTDQTWNVIQRFALRDNRIKAIKQKNKGVSAARNLGLSLADGDYVLFLDSDDWLEDDAVEFLLSRANGRKNIIVSSSCFFTKINKDGIIQKEIAQEEKNDVEISSEEALETVGTPKYRLSSSCYKLFPTSIIRDNGICFNEIIHNAEDGLFTFQCLKEVDYFSYSSEPKWNILDRPGSATTSSYNNKKITALDAMKIMINCSTNSSKITKALHEYYYIWCIELLRDCIKSKILYKNDIKTLRKELRSCKNCWPNNWLIKMRNYALLYLPIPLLRYHFNDNR